jgi:hypothetical protein
MLFSTQEHTECPMYCTDAMNKNTQKPSCKHSDMVTRDSNFSCQAMLLMKLYALQNSFTADNYCCTSYKTKATYELSFNRILFH